MSIYAVSWDPEQNKFGCTQVPREVLLSIAAVQEGHLKFEDIGDRPKCPPNLNPRLNSNRRLTTVATHHSSPDGTPAFGSQQERLRSR